MRPRYIGRGRLFTCNIWNRPQKITRIHETCYSFGPFRYVVRGGLLRR